MKRTIGAALLAAALLLGGCQAGRPDKSLYQHGLEVVALMEEMAGNPTYLSLFSGNEAVLAVLAEAAQGDFSQPKAAYRITLPPSALHSEVEGLSGALRENLEARLAAAVFTQVNAMGGAEQLAAASICTAGKVFVSDELEENAIYLYTYENAVPAAVSFSRGEDGTVSASGVLVLYDGFSAGAAPEVKAFLAELGVEVEEVSP